MPDHPTPQIAEAITDALLAGIVLLFVLDYLDDSIRSGNELEKMGVPVMGVIPDRKK